MEKETVAQQTDLECSRLRDNNKAWTVRLHNNNVIVKRYCTLRDDQLKDIASRLLLYESMLLKEHKAIFRVLAEKNNKIKEQQDLIETLKEQNKKLLRSLNVENSNEFAGYDINQKTNKNRSNDASTLDTQLHIKESSNNASAESDVFRETTTTKFNKYTSIKNRLKKHKSNSDLIQLEESTIMEETDEEVHMSQENIAESHLLQSQKCRERGYSIAGYPLFEISSLINSLPSNKIRTTTDHNQSRHSPVPHIALPPVSNGYNDSDVKKSGVSLPSSGHLHQDYKLNSGKNGEKSIGQSGKQISMSNVDLSLTVKAQNQEKRKSFSGILPTNSYRNESFKLNSSEKNPLKSFKSMLKRKGSKLKKQK